MKAIFFILALLGSVSPLLTLAWLWQIKEWRWDRMLEHLEREGALTQLFGRVRPVMLAAYAATAVAWRGAGAAPVLLCLGAFAALSALQIAMGKQRRPVMTGKAVAAVGVAGALTAAWAAVFLTASVPLLPALPLLQPVTLAVAWALLRPVDLLLKRRIMARARALRERFPEMTVIGITGSVGKTTTKELIACVLQDLGPAVTPAHVNAEIGVARWLISTLTPRPPLPRAGEGGLRIAVVEMGAYRKGEIAQLCEFVKPTMGVVTHVGTQHVALFGSEEALYQAKAELVRSLPLTGRAFLNGDNDRSRAMAAFCACPVTIVGTGGSSDLEAFDIEETGGGIRFRAADTHFDVPLPGTHNVVNVLLALAVGDALGVPFPRMRELLRSFTPLSRTFQVREERGVRMLDDTHNASAASLKAAIAWARTQPEERKVLLTSGLIEMGELQTSHEEELGGLAGNVFERTILLSDLSAKNFAKGGAKDVEVFTRATVPIAPGTLLVCAGRMLPTTITSVLPPSA